MILADYGAYISYLDQIGQNALEAKAVDLQAKTVSSEPFTLAGEGDSAFSAPSFIEKVETKVGRTPLTGAKAMELSGSVKPQAREKMRSYIATADAAANELADKKSKRALKAWTPEKRTEFLANQRSQRNTIASAVAMTGSFGSVNRDDGNTGMGVIEEIKLDAAHPLTPSKQIAVICVNDSRETLKVPVTQLGEAFTEDPGEIFPENEWDESTDIGGEAAIATGNLMAAMKALGGSGKVITYTTDTGEDRMGILLPKSFLTKREAIKARKSIESVEELISYLEKGSKVANGDGSIKWTKGSNSYHFAVPASRAKGGEIWRNPNLNRMAIGGEFMQVGNEMRAGYTKENLNRVFQILTEMGETFSTVPDTTKKDQDGETKTRDSDSPVQRIPNEAWMRMIAEEEGRGLSTSPLPPLRANSPEWKAMNIEERKAYLERKKGKAEFSIRQDGDESPESPFNLYGKYRFPDKSELPQWEQRAVRNAERSAGRGNVRAVRFEPETSERIAPPERFTKELFSLFRKRVAFVSQELGGDQLPFDGLVHSDDPNTIIIDSESRQGMSFLLGHELGHSIQHQQPDLYDSLKETLLDMAKDWSGYRSDLKKLGYDTEAEQDTEFVNDFIGSQFTNPDFWKELGKRDSKVFSNLVSYLLGSVPAKSHFSGEKGRGVWRMKGNDKCAAGVLWSLGEQRMDTG